jgi:CHAT domain-containing protein
MSHPRRIVLAEYFTTDDVTLLFGVRADWDEPEVVEIKQPLPEIRKYVAENFSLDEAKEGETRPTTVSKVRQLDLDEWQERFAPFVEPILKWAEPGDYLYLVPHDVLHYLPLHTLKVEGGDLIERNPVLYTPSASVLKYCQAKRKGQRKTALVLGDSDPENPLPYAYVEALKVAETFGTKPYLGQAAQRSLVKEKLEKEREAIDILHFACHGYFHPFQALKSGILMAPESDQQEPTEFETTLHGLSVNRFLTAEEFFGIEMRADLVTLSACESGVNQVRPGDELFGLMRALIYAGTPSVVMSLWSVDEISSSILMQSFYEALKNGKTKVEALQIAQLAVKNMTAPEAISYCEEVATRLQQVGQHQYRRQVLRDVADLRFQAKDYTAAKIAYENLLVNAEPNSKEYQSLDAAITRCNRMKRKGDDPDYTTRVFDHLFRWAPFVLVGDWK